MYVLGHTIVRLYRGYPWLTTYYSYSLAFVKTKILCFYSNSIIFFKERPQLTMRYAQT